MKVKPKKGGVSSTPHFKTKGSKLNRDSPSKKAKKVRMKLPKSSSSNPQTKKFREAARMKRTTPQLFNPPSSGSANTSAASVINDISNLTLGALEKHNELMGLGTSSMDQADDLVSVGNKTFNTWATNMTGCTNVTFRKVHRYINSNSAMQKEILAVLAAVTEVIQEKGGQGNDVQYFAALVSSIQQEEKVETLAAMTHLLSIVMKKVKVGVLQKEFTVLSKTLVGIITQCASKKDSIGPLKPVISCLACLLRVIDASVWMDPSTEHIYKAILHFISHSKPKLRKAAHIAVRVILRGSILMQGEAGACPPYHPAAPMTAQWCIKAVESASGKGNRTDILHTLTLLKDVLCTFPTKTLKHCCEILLKLMTLTDPVVRSSCLDVFYRFFASKPNTAILPSEMNAQMISALHDHQPSEKDSPLMGAWLRVMEASAVCLAATDPALCLSHLPRLFSAFMARLLADYTETTKAAVASMKVLLVECISQDQKTLQDKAPSSNTSMTHLQKIVKTLDSGLSYQFHSVWGQVLQLWSVVFQVIGKIAPKMVMKSLTSMGDLRDTALFSFKPEMDQAIGSAVKTLGPRIVLDAIPLKISGENDNPDFPRSWLLPLIRDNVTNTELGFFTSYFLPLAATFKKRAETLASEGRSAESTAYDVLQLQIWSMLKGFCDKPTDIKQSFQGIAKTLGTALNERDDLRMEVMGSLRSICTSCQENNDDKKEVGRFAKNFLPILFNLFTAEGQLHEGSRLSVLETIKKYCSVADVDLISNFLNKSLDKMGDQAVGSWRNTALLDLAIAMLGHTHVPALQRVLELSLPRLSSEDRTVQKKAYRVLEEICRRPTQAASEVLDANLSKIKTALLDSLALSSPSSKAPRLRCLNHIYKGLEEENADFFNATLPEAVLCTREIGVRARAAAFELIVVMAETWLKWGEDEAGRLTALVTRLSAGLVGPPHMAAATLLALTRLTHHYRARLPGAAVAAMLEQVCLVLASRTRELVKAALGFLKALLSALDNLVLASHLQQLLDGMHEVAVKGNVRRLTKAVYSKLIKKFGYQLIHSMTKDGVHKLLKNIHKTSERAKKKTEKENEAEESDDDDDEDVRSGQIDSIDDLLQDTDSEMEDDDADEKLSKKKSKQKKKGAWLLEKGDDEIVDFLDPSAAKKVIATNPEHKMSAKGDGDKDRGFKMAADGRLIITKDEDEDDAKKKKKKKILSGGSDDEDDDLEDMFASLDGGNKKNAKKRKATRDEYSDSDAESESAGPSVAKYKAGGRGIHRPLAGAARRTKPQALGAEYQSKKAAGDMKKQGRPDPYAYVPLNIASLNKRKAMKQKGTFNNLVKGAKKGAAKGSKIKHKQGKK